MSSTLSGVDNSNSKAPDLWLSESTKAASVANQHRNSRFRTIAVLMYTPSLSQSLRNFHQPRIHTAARSPRTTHTETGLERIRATNQRMGLTSRSRERKETRSEPRPYVQACQRSRQCRKLWNRGRSCHVQRATKVAKNKPSQESP